MTDDRDSGAPDGMNRALVAELGVIPQLEVYFRRIRADMPADVAAVFAEHGLTARHGGVLAQLAVVASVGVSELARRMAVSLPTASELAGDLRRAGLVVAEEDPDNRRRTLLSLADEHRPSVESLVAARAAPLQRAMERLPERDREGFAAGLRAWADEMRDW
ncbi:MarR family winged helix-turn-helix transcriptional regulator [Nocardiopsis ganjiahuensis]|uniref:MarR family winged helix-turn-helix transcriptional regulator n=1 Tax=Nocardiopsis ganjiahuensis TaxID=239984 RepID=UPI0004774958|nr:MarR family transcriptional regulator [Nocardiopsis ganjiahuensis]